MRIFQETPEMLKNLLESHDQMVKSLTNLESNCCDGAVLGSDSNGHGTCSVCKKNCVGKCIEDPI